MDKEINDLKNLIDIQRGSLVSDYMIGLYNGLELALSIFEHREPKYEERLYADKPGK